MDYDIAFKPIQIKIGLNTHMNSAIQQAVAGNSNFQKYLEKIQKGECLTEVELADIEAGLANVSDALRHSMIRGVVYILTENKYIMADDGKATGGLKYLNENPPEFKNVMFKWMRMLLGTEDNSYALAAIAGVHAFYGEFAAAKETYNELLKDTTLDPDDVKAIRERIDAIGDGDKEFNEAQAAYNAGDYEAAYALLSEYALVASKATEVFRIGAYKNLLANTLIGVYRTTKDETLKAEAERLIAENKKPA